MDSVISWILNTLTPNTIPKVLNQRNALLKYFALNRVFENDTLLYNEQLDGYGKHIFRKEFIRSSYF
jgi:DNA replication and repair protein RecF